MRVLLVPLIVMGAVAGELSEEPNEVQMRGAFERTLAAQVQNTIEFVARSGGPQAALDIQEAGNDRFEVRRFEKRACARIAGQSAYRCDFLVNIDVVNGKVQGAFSGRFTAGPGGLTYAQEEPNAPPTEVAGIL